MTCWSSTSARSSAAAAADGTLGAEVAEIDDAARMAVAGVRPLGGQIRDGLRAMHARGDLPASADRRPGLATLAALQGGLSWPRSADTRPLEVALDAMLDRIQALTDAAGTEAA